MSATPVKSNLLKILELFVNKVPTVSYRRTFCEKGREEITQQGGQSGQTPNALSYEQLGSCAYFIEAHMEFARKK